MVDKDFQRIAQLRLAIRGRIQLAVPHCRIQQKINLSNGKKINFFSQSSLTKWFLLDQFMLETIAQIHHRHAHVARRISGPFIEDFLSSSDRSFGKVKYDKWYWRRHHSVIWKCSLLFSLHWSLLAYQSDPKSLDENIPFSYQVKNSNWKRMENLQTFFEFDADAFCSPTQSWLRFPLLSPSLSDAVSILLDYA